MISTIGNLVDELFHQLPNNLRFRILGKNPNIPLPRTVARGNTSRNPKIPKKSPKREPQLINTHTKGLPTENDKQNKAKTIRALSDARRPIRRCTPASIIQHYKELKGLMELVLKRLQGHGKGSQNLCSNTNE